MKDAMWTVDGSERMSFRDPLTRGAVPVGQLDLLHEVQQENELAELLMQRLAVGTASVLELGSWLLRETARWRRLHARSAVTKMREAGLVEVSPPGRVTANSLVELRR